MIAVLVGVGVLSAVWVVALGVDDDAPSVTGRLAAGNGALNAILILVLVAAASPLAEESLFRGYAFRALSNRRGFWPAAITTSVVFAVSHIGWSPMGLVVPVGLFGFGACVLYYWTRSLFAPPRDARSSTRRASARCSRAGSFRWRSCFAVVATLVIARLIAVVLGGGADPGAEMAQPTSPVTQ